MGFSLWPREGWDSAYTFGEWDAVSMVVARVPGVVQLRRVGEGAIDIDTRR